MDRRSRDRLSRVSALTGRAKAVIPGGVSSYARKFDHPINFDRGQGSKVYDLDGNEYVDYLQAWGAIVLGHSDAAVNGRVFETLEDQDLYGMGTTELEVDVAEQIVEHVPSAERVLFGVTGSEVVARAITLARAVTGGEKVVKFQGHYHGWYDPVAMNHLEGRPSDPALASSGLPDGVVNETIVLPFNDGEAVETAVSNHDDIAAIILEPVAHNMGCIPPAPGYLQTLRKLADEHDIVLIFDEIVTGFRHDFGGVQRLEGVEPDLTTLGKSIANGYPMSVLCGSAELMERFVTAEDGDVAFGGTYNAHASALAAAKATMEELASRAFHNTALTQCEEISTALTEIIDDLGIEAHVSRYGTVFLTYFMSPPPERYADIVAHHDDGRYARYRRAMIDRGILMVPKPVRRNYLTASHTEEDIQRTIDAAAVALESVAP